MKPSICLLRTSVCFLLLLRPNNFYEKQKLSTVVNIDRVLNLIKNFSKLERVNVDLRKILRGIAAFKTSFD